MNRRSFLLGTGAAAAAIAAGRPASATVAGAFGPGMHVGFAPPAGGRLVAASRHRGGERIAGAAEARIALGGEAPICVVEVAVGDGPRFRALGAQACGGVVQVGPPRRFEAAGRFTVWVGEEAIAFGPGAFPLVRGSYVIALGAAPRWGELALVDGVLRDTSGGAVVQPHLVLDLERGGLATV